MSSADAIRNDEYDAKIDKEYSCDAAADGDSDDADEEY